MSTVVPSFEEAHRQILEDISLFEKSIGSKGEGVSRIQAKAFDEIMEQIATHFRDEEQTWLDSENQGGGLDPVEARRLREDHILLLDELRNLSKLSPNSRELQAAVRAWVGRLLAHETWEKKLLQTSRERQ